MELYGNITGISSILDCSITQSHSSTTSTAVITTDSHTLTVGDAIQVDIGYVGDHDVVFNGYVKQIEHEVPNDTYVITANDVLIRAVDYYIAPVNPNDTYKRTNILAEDLVSDLLGMAGITSTDLQPTLFTLAVNGTEVEVKLVSAYDYIKSIADLVAWNIWADVNGVVHFRNRKPYVMTGTSGQPGDIADVPTGYIIDNTSNNNLIDITYTESAVDLRNKVIVWGGNEIHAEASAVSPYLPSGFYKTIVFSNSIVDSFAMAEDTALYNLALFNRLGKEISATVVGNHSLSARTVININETVIGLNSAAYVYAVTHEFGSSGFRTSLQLRI